MFMQAQAEINNSLFPKSERSPFQADACSNCGASSEGGANISACSRCKTARYCGKACQAQQWKADKRTCKAAKKQQKQKCQLPSGSSG